MTRALIPFANGSEEMETIILVDVLRRAGWEVVLADIQGNKETLCSRNVRIVPDAKWESLDLLSFDLIVLPGGMGGAKAFCNHSGVQETLRIFNIEELWIAAVCAAPIALHEAGVLENRKFTCYPGDATLNIVGRENRSNEPVVVDGHVVTSQGPGTTMSLALKLIELIDGKDKADKIASKMIFKIP